jgi:exodeoxyribonuclease III
MRITTWNVNSVRKRLDIVLQWLERNQPDVLCLQETKCTDDQFPWIAFEAIGYRIRFAGQKGYNGVAIASRSLQVGTEPNPVWPVDETARSIAASIAGHRILNVYVPHGDEVGSAGYRYKLRWLEELAGVLGDESGRPAVVAGDFNVAPDDRDVYDPAARREKLICSTPEREGFGKLLEAGYVDAFRENEDGPGHYTWWSHRVGAASRNRGLRVDHHLVDRDLRSSIRGVRIDRAERRRQGASDHAPVTLELNG